jgi:hypothetical protein
MKDTAMAKKFSASKLASLFGDGPPKVVDEPSFPLKGEARRGTKSVEPVKSDERAPAPVVATTHDLRVFLELPPTEADLRTLATTSLDPGTRVMRYHSETGWGVCLMWMEQQVRDGNTVLARVHAVVQGAGGDLDYAKMRPEEHRNFADIKGGYPIGPAIDAFRAQADRVGASREARKLLGMSDIAPPKMIREIIRSEDGKLIGERMVAKMSRNDPSQGPPKVNADTDELYERAAKLLELKEEDLRAKYGHLNPGMQSMNLRNRLRAKGFNV